MYCVYYLYYLLLTVMSNDNNQWDALSYRRGLANTELTNEEEYKKAKTDQKTSDSP